MTGTSGDKLQEFQTFLEGEVQKRNMSYREFAHFVDVATTTITRSLDKKNPAKPGLDFLLKLSKATRVSVGDLIELAYPDAAQQTQVSPSSKVLAQRIEQLPDHVRDVINRIIQGEVN